MWNNHHGILWGIIGLLVAMLITIGILDRRTRGGGDVVVNIDTNASTSPTTQAETTSSSAAATSQTPNASTVPQDLNEDINFTKGFDGQKFVLGNTERMIVEPVERPKKDLIQFHESMTAERAAANQLKDKLKEAKKKVTEKSQAQAKLNETLGRAKRQVKGQENMIVGPAEVAQKDLVRIRPSERASALAQLEDLDLIGTTDGIHRYKNHLARIDPSFRRKEQMMAMSDDQVTVRRYRGAATQFMGIATTLHQKKNERGGDGTLRMGRWPGDQRDGQGTVREGGIINIDHSGFGHTRYTASRFPQAHRKLYPMSLDRYRYVVTPTTRSGNRAKLVQPYFYAAGRFDRIVAAQNKEQRKRDEIGFSEPTMGVLEQRYRETGGQLTAFQDKDTELRHDEVVLSVTAHHEQAVADEMGETGHSFTTSNYNQAGESSAVGAINADAYSRDDVDWDKVREEMTVTVNDMLALFDQYFSDVFPHATIRIQDDGLAYIREDKEASAMCIDVAKYYEFVKASIVKELGLGETPPLGWAKNTTLGFQDLEKNKNGLRQDITKTCDLSIRYLIGKDGIVKSKSGSKISVEIPWPKDKSILLEHYMRFRKT